MIELDNLKQLIEDTTELTDDESKNDWYVADVYSIESNLFGDGKCEHETLAAQVEVYCEYMDIRDAKVDLLRKELQKQENYTQPTTELLFDEIADRYRATLNFKIFR